MGEIIDKANEIGRRCNDYVHGNLRYSEGNPCKRCGSRRKVARKSSKTGKVYQYCKRCENHRFARKNRELQRKNYPPLRLPESEKKEAWSYEDYDI